MEVSGEIVSPSAMTVLKARELAHFLARGSHQYAAFVACRKQSDGEETVVFDVAVEVGQEPKYDIRRWERIAASFRPADATYPDVVALRPDFPADVPHRSLRDQELPIGLCLYEEPYSEVKLRWTPPVFVERIRYWLARTAEGTLHQQDQPLEPILLGPALPLILPTKLRPNPSASDPGFLKVTARPASPKGYTFVAVSDDKTIDASGDGVSCVAIAIECTPQQHGIIRKRPKNLADLQQLLATGGRDLFSELAGPLDKWKRDARLLDSRLIIVVVMPKCRQASGPAESTETWAFLVVPTIREVAVQSGLYATDEKGCLGRLLRRDESRTGADVPVDVLNPMFALSRTRAALLNGLPGPDDRRIAAVGLGALGSQVVMNLVRAAYGHWTFIDDDHLLPHNIARHELTADFVGYNKAESMAHWANSVVDGEPATKFIAANVLTAGPQTDQAVEALKTADVVADFSASLAVARHLARDADSKARRISFFLNPDGTDLVMIAEDAHRRCRLDALEMQYYREVLNRPELALHVSADDTRLRYAPSCRDVTSRVPQDLMSLQAAIASRALRRAVGEETPSLRIWKAGDDLSVHSVTVPPAQVREYHLGDWILVTDDALINDLRNRRREKLPNETGGVLLGSFDVSRRLLYVAASTGSPPDSVEYPVHYIRGCEGLREEVRQAEIRTGGMLQYVGEWHSHPEGCGCDASADDRTVFEWIRTYMQPEGLPPLMCIVGETREAWYLAEIVT